ncbi:ATP-binding protein [Anaeroselena agilis]|uniref:histidine kinase n=1 Tax=Anaeroselena agilis TaxID=3063788 RepID=A0ABU3NZA7_9FIRM|nr:ATP-binding protein [Selenomonadales bacterium 4137-cl]
MFSSGIRNRLIASFLLLVGVTLLALGSYVLWFFHDYNTERLKGNLLIEAKISEQLLLPYMKGPREKASIEELIRELVTKVDHRITVIDNNGVVLADSWENPAVMENHRQRPEVIDAIAEGQGDVIRYSSTIGENFLYVAIPMRDGAETVGVVRVAATLAHVEAAFGRIRTVLLLAFFVTSLFAVLVSFRLARKYTAPLETITKVARHMGQGHLNRRVHIRTGDEIEVLAHTLNNLAASLDDKINEIVAEKRKLELILENMDNAVVLLDRYGQVTDVNRQAAVIFGITPAMLGQHNIQVIGHSALEQAVRQTVDEGRSRHIDLKTNFADVKRVFQVFLAPILNTDNEPAGVLCVFHDITALKEIEERQADFVANASHELGTPLTAIKGFAETLLDGALSDPKLSVKFITIIQEEADRMHRLVKELMQLARLNSAEYRQQVRLEPTDVAAVAETVIGQLYPQWRAKGLNVALAPGDGPVRAMANPDWLTQVLVNLLDNSIKFTPSGGRVTVACAQDAGSAVITVEDTGVGIPAADLPLIFDRFYRVDKARVREGGGSGLGLSIVKFIVDTLGGTIAVKSKAGEGTTFTITLPLAE